MAPEYIEPMKRVYVPLEDAKLARLLEQSEATGEITPSPAAASIRFCRSARLRSLAFV